MVVRTTHIVALKIVHQPGENRKTSGHVHVDSLALIQLSRIKLVNIKKINQNNMLITISPFENMKLYPDIILSYSAIIMHYIKR